MATARFSIGIDLGTTNSAMAFVPLAGNAPSEVFPVPQWQSVTELAVAPTLPSFLYLPEDAVAAQMQGRDDSHATWIVGALARNRAGDTPGRVAHSAKSWLCHHTVDRSTPFLPWASDDVAPDRKISPVRASALILNYLRGAWDNRFAGSGEDFRFDAQEITVTVPASFDAAAQRLTIEAARDAAFPETVRLLEEPQAAFYRWLEQNGAADGLTRHVPDPGAPTHHVLVVDVGGGTSDFSLFALSHRAGGAVPAIRRLAVSDHILLGGDNIDLALAHLIEPRLASDGASLSRGQWDHLVARCRDLKEHVLATGGAPEDRFPLSIPARGSGLIAGALSAGVTRGEIDAVLLDGFFPTCDAGARPIRTRAALKELGLPYASDSAVTKHLVDFLRDRPRVDAVLFNGGTLYPQALRDRLQNQIGTWQGGALPVVLTNPEPDLAVACGAAWFGKLLHLKQERIEAGAARAIFIAAHAAKLAAGEAVKGPPSLICIVPRGASSEQTFEITDHPLELRTDRPVRFQAYASTRHGKTPAGAIVDWTESGFQPLPPLETVAKLDDPVPDLTRRRTVPVTLTARLNELGLLKVACVSTDAEIRQVWPLEFNLRPHEQDRATTGAAPAAPPQANAPAEAVAAAQARIETLFNQPLQRKDKLSAARLLKSLETILGIPKGEWNGVLVRSLWPALARCMPCRRLSVEHEETWFILAGYLLRPGFGAALDEARIDELWRVRAAGTCFPGKRIKLQEHILWRRVAGGLPRDRQERVLAGDLDTIRRKPNLPAELVLLAGALERLGPELKAELIHRFIAIAEPLARDHKHCAPILAALGMLLNRTPVYAGPETVVSPDLVEDCYGAFKDLDWSAPELAELQTLFLRAARVVDNRTLDAPKALRHRIATKLERAGVPPAKTAALKQFTPLARAEGASLFGDSLPPGLLLREDEA